MKDSIKLMIATKLVEMIGIVCEGIGSQYGVNINLKSKLDIEVEPKKGRTKNNGTGKKIH